MGHQPERMCVICRRRLPQQALHRLVLTADGVQYAARGKLEGRGFYLCDQETCLHQAGRRPFRAGQVTVPALSAEVLAKIRAVQQHRLAKAEAKHAQLPQLRDEAEYQAKLAAYLGLARKAGHLQYGLDAVTAAWREGQYILVSEATSPATLDKIQRRFPEEAVDLIPLSKEALGAAIGRVATAVVLLEDEAMKTQVQSLVEAWRRQKGSC